MAQKAKEQIPEQKARPTTKKAKSKGKTLVEVFDETESVPVEKKAVAYIDSSALLELLKMPYRIELVSLEFPSRDGQVKIILKGEPLPIVASAGVDTDNLPEVTYKILRHWHNASIAVKETKG